MVSSDERQNSKLNLISVHLHFKTDGAIILSKCQFIQLLELCFQYSFKFQKVSVFQISNIKQTSPNFTRIANVIFHLKW